MACIVVSAAVWVAVQLLELSDGFVMHLFDFGSFPESDRRYFRRPEPWTGRVHVSRSLCKRILYESGAGFHHLYSVTLYPGDSDRCSGGGRVWSADRYSGSPLKR